eukprot:jgi/Galph1/1891/GphlegSOOS_G566.1
MLAFVTLYGPSLFGLQRSPLSSLDRRLSYSFYRSKIFFCSYRKTRYRSVSNSIVAQYNYNIFQDDVDRSRRKVQPGERAFYVRKPLGLVLEEAEDGMVFVADIDPNGNAARASRGNIRKGDILVAISATFGDEVWSTRGVGLARVMKGIQVRFGDEITLIFESPQEVETRKQSAEELAAKRRQEAREKFGDRPVVDPVTWRTVTSKEVVADSTTTPGTRESSVPKYAKVYEENRDVSTPVASVEEFDYDEIPNSTPNRSTQYIFLWSLAGMGLIALTAFLTLR